MIQKTSCSNCQYLIEDTINNFLTCTKELTNIISYTVFLLIYRGEKQNCKYYKRKRKTLTQIVLLVDGMCRPHFFAQNYTKLVQYTLHKILCKTFSPCASMIYWPFLFRLFQAILAALELIFTSRPPSVPFTGPLTWTRYFIRARSRSAILGHSSGLRIDSLSPAIPYSYCRTGPGKFFPHNGIVGHEKGKCDMLYTGREYWQKIGFAASTWLLYLGPNPWKPWQAMPPSQDWQVLGWKILEG